MNKRIFLLLALATLTLYSQAQTAFARTKSNPTGAVVNTGADTATATIAGYFETLVITPVATKVSGTVAGTAILQLSTTGAVGTWSSPVGDTLTLTNVATSFKNMEHPKSPYIFFRVITTGTGTMSATMLTSYIAKKTSF